MQFTVSLVIAIFVSTVLVGLAALAALAARSTSRRLVDLGVVSQRWLLAHRAEN